MLKINKYIYYYAITTKHKFYVLYYMTITCAKLMWRAITHDLTKYSLIEARGLAKFTNKFVNIQYGSKEYNDILSKEKETVAIHYKRNSHHPEFYNGDVSKMSFYDLCETVIDWKSAVKKNINGNIERSFNINKERFNIPDNILKIMKSI